MNQLGVVLFWCMLQVTVVAVVTQLVAVLCRRRLMGGAVVSAGLIVVALLTALAFSPWPAWGWYRQLAARIPIPAAGPVDPTLVPSDRNDGLDSTAPESTAVPSERSADAPWNTIVRSATPDQTNGRVAKSQSNPGWRWGEIIAAVVIGCCLIGFLRVLTGILAVRRVVVRAASISDRGLSELVDILRAELSCRTPIRLLESRELATAATTGWRQPAILLPTEWRTWTDLERRAVLAHEIAHVRSRDFLACIAAQCSLAMHFYHPVVHWLVHTLRMDLELAADAAASSIVGPTQYLRTLANMALRQQDRPLGWPARTFLPTRGTFLRRIEMLRDNGTSPRKPWASVRLAGLGIVALAGLAAAGLRATADRTGIISSLGIASLGDDASPATVEWVPADAAGVLVSRPKQLLQARPEMAELLKSFRPPPLSMLELQLGDVEQLTLGLIPEKAPAAQPPGGSAPPREFTVVRFAAPTKKTTPLTPTNPVGETEFLGYRLHFEGPTCWFQPDDRTLVFSSAELIKVSIASGKQSRWKLQAADGWRQVASNPIALAVNTEIARPWFDHAAAGASWLEPYAPIWTNTSAIFIGGSLNDQVKISGYVQCRAASDVEPVSDTLAAAVTLAKNTAGRYRERLAEVQGESERALVAGLLDLADQLLASVRLEKLANNQLRFGTATGLAPESIRLLTQVLSHASTASTRAVAMNNMKQIMLAMHNYHDVYGHFPPAIVQGRDGKGGPPHSWRIELLPFLEAAQLYEAYRFDEPWDSESNKAILARMPAAFRIPGDPPTSTNAGYFGLVGPGTLFSNAKGTRMVEIADGTSNTIALVEARREIPWTKPEDIVYSPDKPVPQLGSGPSEEILVAICDGSVRMIPRNLDPNIIRAMLTIAGGEVIPVR